MFIYSIGELKEIGGYGSCNALNRSDYVISCQRKKRKRGKRGGVKLRNKKRSHSLPLPKIILSNIRSIRNKTDELAALCRYDQHYRTSDLIFITETWLTENDLKEENITPFQLDHFDLYALPRSNSVGKTKGGGVCLYINTCWSRNNHVITRLCNRDVEMLTLSIRPHYLPREISVIYSVCVYIPCTSCKENAIKLIEDDVSKFQLKHPDAAIIIAGDFNKSRHIQPPFKQYVSVPTRQLTTLDKCFCNIKNAYKSLQLSNIGRSDHNSVLLQPTYKSKLLQFKPTTIQMFNWTPESVQKLQGCFESTTWDTFLDESETIDEWVEVVTKYILFCRDTCVDRKEIKIYPNNKPWISKDIKCTINRKKIAHMQGNKDEEKEAAKEMREKIKKGKIQYKQKMEEKLKKSDARGAWSMIKQMGGLPDKKSGKGADIEIDPNDLNDFYCRFEPQQPAQSNVISYSSTNDSPPIEISVEFVKHIFKKCNPHKTAGPDNISGHIIKNCSDQLSSPFLKIFQRSLQEQKIPTVWKTSTIIPVPKKRQAVQLNDYRPIALTSIVMKCFEKIMKREILQFLFDHNVLDPLQFAYQQNRSVQDALLTFTHIISNHLDQSTTNYVRALYIDFSSAFNAMNTNILIQKLHDLDLPNYLINWYHDFLICRPQCVKIGGLKSTQRTLSNGCPQGCVSSPLLYILYTNNCRSNSSLCYYIKYADDTAILGLLNRELQNENLYFDEINAFQNWCEENRLELNPSKTKEQIFGSMSNENNILKVTLNNQEVEIVDNFKYLGLFVNSALNFVYHVERVLEKCNQRLYVLRKLRSFEVSNKVLVQVYRSLILSIMTFCIPVWYGSCRFKEKCKLQRCVKEAGKIVGVEQNSITNHFNQATANSAFSILNDKYHPLCNNFKLLPSGRRYDVPRNRTNRHSNTFIPTGIKLVNIRLSKKAS